MFGATATCYCDIFNHDVNNGLTARTQTHARTHARTLMYKREWHMDNINPGGAIDIRIDHIIRFLLAI